MKKKQVGVRRKEAAQLGKETKESSNLVSIIRTYTIIYRVAALQAWRNFKYGWC